MKLSVLKNILDRMSENELSQDLMVVAQNKTLSGHGLAVKSKVNLIYSGDDDPCELKTELELIDEGFDNEEINKMKAVVKTGGFYIQLH